MPSNDLRSCAKTRDPHQKQRPQVERCLCSRQACTSTISDTLQVIAVHMLRDIAAPDQQTPVAVGPLPLFLADGASALAKQLIRLAAFSAL